MIQDTLTKDEKERIIRTWTHAFKVIWSANPGVCYARVQVHGSAFSIETMTYSEYNDMLDQAFAIVHNVVYDTVKGIERDKG